MDPEPSSRSPTTHSFTEHPKRGKNWAESQRWQTQPSPSERRSRGGWPRTQHAASEVCRVAIGAAPTWLEASPSSPANVHSDATGAATNGTRQAGRQGPGRRPLRRGGETKRVYVKNRRVKASHVAASTVVADTGDGILLAWAAGGRCHDRPPRKSSAAVHVHLETGSEPRAGTTSLARRCHCPLVVSSLVGTCVRAAQVFRCV